MQPIRFPKKEKKDTPVTVRLKASTVVKLKHLADTNDLTQTDIIEHLIESAFESTHKKAKK